MKTEECAGPDNSSKKQTIRVRCHLVGMITPDYNAIGR